MGPFFTGLLKLILASLIDGARLSRTRVQVYPHADLAALEALRSRAAARQAVAMLITEARPIYFSDVEGFDAISLGSVVEKVLPFLPIPNGALIFLVVAVVSAILLNKTTLGRYTFALGSNEEAVRLSGVNADRWKVIIYTLSGAICSISGLLVASRLNSAQPALGQGYELDAIAAVPGFSTALATKVLSGLGIELPSPATPSDVS